MLTLYVLKLKNWGDRGEYAIGYVWESDTSTDDIYALYTQDYSYPRGDYSLQYSVSVPNDTKLGVAFILGYIE